MASMNTRLNIEKLDGNIVQKYGGSKQVGFKKLGPGVETGVHRVHDGKRIWFEVELQRAKGDREAEVFQVSNDDTAVAQRRSKDKKPEDKTNTDCLVKEQEKKYQTYGRSIRGYNNRIEETTRSTYLVNRSPSSAIGFKKPIDMNMSFNESREYKKTFIGSGVGTCSMQVLHGFKFEVELLGDHTFEVEPQENVDQGAGLQEAEIWATKSLVDKAKGNVLGMEIVRDQSGNTLRVSQSRFYNGKLVQTLLEGHSITSLEDSLSGDCDKEKNDVGMLDKVDHGLQTDVQVFVNFDYAMGRSITVMELGYKLNLVSGIAIGAMVKDGSRSEVSVQVEVDAYRLSGREPDTQTGTKIFKQSCRETFGEDISILVARSHGRSSMEPICTNSLISHHNHIVHKEPENDFQLTIKNTPEIMTELEVNDVGNSIEQKESKLEFLSDKLNMPKGNDVKLQNSEEGANIEAWKNHARSTMESKQQDSNEAINNSKDNSSPDAEVMDYAQPHRKPPIHNVKT
uniref:Zinc finger, CCHC-type n=1 Tax=Tanacetum cinerariifolium TaxID=118510 RepID=A0A6L2JC69_TANCI|nr:zinc finger, CCHC-type [Tanacetum cinerariifolium]